MDPKEESTALSRKKIGVRLLYTLLFLIVLEILKTVIQLAVVFQYIHLFITTRYSEPVRNFSGKVAVYAYKVMRYVTLLENGRPFPFSDFPKEHEAPEPEALFE